MLAPRTMALGFEAAKRLREGFAFVGILEERGPGWGSRTGEVRWGEMGWQSKNRLNLPKYIMVSVRLTSLCLEEYHRFMFGWKETGSPRMFSQMGKRRR